MILKGVIALTSPNHSVISPNSVAFGTDCVKVVEDNNITYTFIVIVSWITVHIYTTVIVYTTRVLTFCGGNVGQRI